MQVGGFYCKVCCSLRVKYSLSVLWKSLMSHNSARVVEFVAYNGIARTGSARQCTSSRILDIYLSPSYSFWAFPVPFSTNPLKGVSERSKLFTFQVENFYFMTFIIHKMWHSRSRRLWNSDVFKDSEISNVTFCLSVRAHVCENANALLMNPGYPSLYVTLVIHA